MLEAPPPACDTAEELPPGAYEPGGSDSADQTTPSGNAQQPPPLPQLDSNPDKGPDYPCPAYDEDSWNALKTWGKMELIWLWTSLPADKWQTAFNSLLVLVGFLQWRVYRTQTKIMRETREVSFAALGRPHVFFHFAAHSFEDWRGGRTELWFGFRLVNYGTGPAIVRHVVARAFLSRGPGTQEDSKNISIKEFPKAQHFVQFAAQGSDIYFMDIDVRFDDVNFEVFPERAQSFRDHPFVIAPKERTGVFATSVPVVRPTKPRADRTQAWHETYLYDVTSGRFSDGGWVRPWLAGQIVYDDTFGRRHHTNFCVSANSDGTVTHEEGGVYDQRT